MEDSSIHFELFPNLFNHPPLFTLGAGGAKLREAAGRDGEDAAALVGSADGVGAALIFREIPALGVDVARVVAKADGVALGVPRVGEVDEQRRVFLR